MLKFQKLYPAAYPKAVPIRLNVCQNNGNRMNSLAMETQKKTLKKLSFKPEYAAGNERFGFTSRRDMPPIKTEFTPPQYTYIVEWQLEEMVVSTSAPH